MSATERKALAWRDKHMAAGDYVDVCHYSPTRFAVWRSHTECRCHPVPKAYAPFLTREALAKLGDG